MVEIPRYFVEVPRNSKIFCRSSEKFQDFQVGLQSLSDVNTVGISRQNSRFTVIILDKIQELPICTSQPGWMEFPNKIQDFLVTFQYFW